MVDSSLCDIHGDFDTWEGFVYTNSLIEMKSYWVGINVSGQFQQCADISLQVCLSLCL